MQKKKAVHNLVAVIMIRFESVGTISFLTEVMTTCKYLFVWSLHLGLSKGPGYGLAQPHKSSNLWS
ncbi:hypothetical protein J4Q44_G00394000 [Coregonus suidteri]|uniref:Uncharacterized protein n=1 Tax=Coregonus suidteri TaxID=861788 RepID=A0AAN8KJF2_9TELE